MQATPQRPQADPAEGSSNRFNTVLAVTFDESVVQESSDATLLESSVLENRGKLVIRKPQL